ncbi:MAG: hypothetical protein R3E65_00465 [Steroidobacteraceae bacterium]
MTEPTVSDSEPDREPSFLPHPAMDRMLDTLVALSAELWAERERRATLEQVLVRRGLLDVAEIEAYRGTAVDEAQRKSERDAYVRRLFGSMGQL